MDYYYIDNKYCSGEWKHWSYLGRFVTFSFRLAEIFYRPTTTAEPVSTTAEPTTTINPNVQMGTTPFYYDYYEDGWWSKPTIEEWHQPAGFEIHFRCVDDPWHDPTTTEPPTTKPPTTKPPTTKPPTTEPPTTEPKTTLNFNYVSGLDQEYLIIKREVP